VHDVRTLAHESNHELEEEQAATQCAERGRPVARRSLRRIARAIRRGALPANQQVEKPPGSTAARHGQAAEGVREMLELVLLRCQKRDIAVAPDQALSKLERVVTEASPTGGFVLHDPERLRLLAQAVSASEGKEHTGADR
jgi:hypothetical protein